jgi:hypothetical protein
MRGIGHTGEASGESAFSPRAFAQFGPQRGRFVAHGLGRFVLGGRGGYIAAQDPGAERGADLLRREGTVVQPGLFKLAL